jgi:hypothetical protein
MCFVLWHLNGEGWLHSCIPRKYSSEVMLLHHRCCIYLHYILTPENVVSLNVWNMFPFLCCCDCDILIFILLEEVVTWRISYFEVILYTLCPHSGHFNMFIVSHYENKGRTSRERSVNAYCNMWRHESVDNNVNHKICWSVVYSYYIKMERLCNGMYQIC